MPKDIKMNVNDSGTPLIHPLKGGYILSVLRDTSNCSNVCLIVQIHPQDTLLIWTLGYVP